MKKITLALGMLLNFSILQAQVLIKVEMDEAVIAARKFPSALQLIANQVSVISAKEIAQANQPNTADLLQNSGQILIRLLLRNYLLIVVVVVILIVRKNNIIILMLVIFIVYTHFILRLIIDTDLVV